MWNILREKGKETRYDLRACCHFLLGKDRIKILVFRLSISLIHWLLIKIWNQSLIPFRCLIYWKHVAAYSVLIYSNLFQYHCCIIGKENEPEYNKIISFKCLFVPNDFLINKESHPTLFLIIPRRARRYSHWDAKEWKKLRNICWGEREKWQ